MTTSVQSTTLVKVICSMVVKGHNPMGSQTLLRMFILDVLQHDVVEPLQSVLRLLNNRGYIGWRHLWPHDFKATEVVESLRELIDNQLVLVYQESRGELIQAEVTAVMDGNTDFESIWFGRTATGTAEWNAWEPPEEVDQVQTPG